MVQYLSTKYMLKGTANIMLGTLTAPISYLELHGRELVSKTNNSILL
jgi:hypothetical protein